MRKRRELPPPDKQSMRSLQLTSHLLGKTDRIHTNIKSKTKISSLTTSNHNVLEILAKAIKQEKEKGIQTGKEKGFTHR